MKTKQSWMSRFCAFLMVVIGFVFGAPQMVAAAAADAAITAAVDNLALTFAAVLAAGLIITASMIGWGFLKRLRKG